MAINTAAYASGQFLVITDFTSILLSHTISTDILIANMSVESSKQCDEGLSLHSKVHLVSCSLSTVPGPFSNSVYLSPLFLYFFSANYFMRDCILHLVIIMNAFLLSCI